MLSNFPWLQKTYDFLVDSYHAQRAHHAYILVYNGEIGQEALINLFSQFLLCRENSRPEQRLPCGQCRACQAYNLKSNGDLFDLQAGDPEKLISVDSIRTMIERIELEPVTSAQNVVTIYNASKFNSYSANAILKTLEEPPAHTHFLLGLPAGYSVLPTIRSRCMVLNLPEPSPEQIEEFLSYYEIAQPERSYLKYLAPKQPSLMLKMHQKDFMHNYLNLNQKLLTLMQNLEVADFVEAFNCNDLEVFSWQLESLSQLLTYIGKVFLLNETDEHDPLAQIFKFDENSATIKVINYLKESLQEAYDVEKLYDLVDRLLILHTQLTHFAPQLGSENSLKGIAYKIGSLIALFTYSLMNISNPEEFYIEQLKNKAQNQ
ncbi:hypothetical protein [Psittacicella gerlachiana]|uniref:DNA-directed DNA polymerase n=1 Tax=Psittacicella gerlachiana TaxID=2028574 RepID=A0A3A1YS61_9GAMM|nr:hypothetical protein [Psittacicella gerlachiana]RIY38857.1 hypothetical protein CKF59_00205 [Psittacicella gerlachiana]